MKTKYAPTDYSTVSPYLIAEDADASIDFLKRVFDATELRRMPSASGTIRHAEVRVGDTVIMLADPVLPDWPAIASNVHVFVEDVDAIYRKALDAGATSVQAPATHDDEDRRAGVKDVGGTTWWITGRAG